MSTRETAKAVNEMLGLDRKPSPIFDKLFGSAGERQEPSPLTMLCDLHADGSCDSLGSDFCEFECPNRSRVTLP